MAEEEQTIPLWQKLAAAAFVIVWAVIIVLWHGRFKADIYPLDRSYVAPNLLASFILFSLGLILGAIFWPPVRKTIHRFADKKLAPIHEHFEHSRIRQEHLIKQNAHIIKSSKTIKDIHEDGTDLTKMPEL